MKNPSLFVALFISVLISSVVANSSQIIKYSGELTSTDGTLISGQRKMKFILLDASTNKSVWSHDGQGVGSDVAEPTSSIDVNITNGKFVVQLGDATVSNMTIIPIDAFKTKNVLLRVWIANDSNVFEQLNPDKVMTAAPFAFHALNADIADDSIKTEHILDGTILSADLGTLSSVDIDGGSIDGVVIGSANAATGTFSHITTENLTVGGSLTLAGHAFPTALGTENQFLMISDKGNMIWGNLPNSFSGSSIENSPIGLQTPNQGNFTSLSAETLSVSGSTSISGHTFPGAPGSVGQVLIAGNDGNLIWQNFPNSLVGGSVENSPIGIQNPNQGRFTKLSSQTLNVSGNVVISGHIFPQAPGTLGQVLTAGQNGNLVWQDLPNSMLGGSIENSPIGLQTPNAGRFTILSSDNLIINNSAVIAGQAFPSQAGQRGEVLTTGDNGSLVWESAKMPPKELVNISSNHTITNEDFVKANSTSANVIVTLPLASASIAKVIHVFKPVDNNDVIISRQGNDNINETLTNVILKNKGDHAKLISDGSGWWTVNSKDRDSQFPVAVNNQFSNIDVNGGEIDGTPIGSNASSTGKFTDLTTDNLEVTGDAKIRGQYFPSQANEANKVLTTSGNGHLEWKSVPNNNSPVQFLNVSENTVVGDQVKDILANASAGDIEITLPLASENAGRTLKIIRTDPTNGKRVRVLTQNGEKFNANRDIYDIVGTSGTLILISDGHRWLVTDEKAGDENTDELGQTDVQRVATPGVEYTYLLGSLSDRYSNFYRYHDNQIDKYNYSHQWDNEPEGKWEIIRDYYKTSLKFFPSRNDINQTFSFRTKIENSESKLSSDRFFRVKVNPMKIRHEKDLLLAQFNQNVEPLFAKIGDDNNIIIVRNSELENKNIFTTISTHNANGQASRIKYNIYNWSDDIYSDNKIKIHDFVFADTDSDYYYPDKFYRIDTKHGLTYSNFSMGSDYTYYPNTLSQTSNRYLGSKVISWNVFEDTKPVISEVDNRNGENKIYVLYGANGNQQVRIVSSRYDFPVLFEDDGVEQVARETNSHNIGIYQDYVYLQGYNTSTLKYNFTLLNNQNSTTTKIGEYESDHKIAIVRNSYGSKFRQPLIAYNKYEKRFIYMHIVDNSLAAEEFGGIEINPSYFTDVNTSTMKFKNAVHNGGYVYISDGMSKVEVHNIKDNNAKLTINHPDLDTSVFKGVNSNIINIPEGVNRGKSAARLRLIGKGVNDISPTFYIRDFLIEPED